MTQLHHLILVRARDGVKVASDCCCYRFICEGNDVSAQCYLGVLRFVTVSTVVDNSIMRNHVT